MDFRAKLGSFLSKNQLIRKTHLAVVFNTAKGGINKCTASC